MNWIRRFAKSAAVVVVSVLVALIASELIVRATGRYADVAGMEIGGTNKIWERYASFSDRKLHPDTYRLVHIEFNAFGARASSQTDNRLGAVNVGVFGDSFTENRSMGNKFSFTSVMNELSEHMHFHNFGVSGYGLEQSFQNWLDKRNVLDMKVVLYLFCANDLGNTHTVQLFDRKKMSKGIVENIASLTIPLHIRVLSKSHIIYLFVEGYNKAKTILSPERAIYSMEQYLQRVGSKYSAAKPDKNQRDYWQYGYKLARDYLSSSPSKQTLDTVEHFQNTLKVWKDMVEESGGVFYFVSLARKEELLLSTRIVSNQIALIQLESNDAIELLRNYPWKFENDGHWNEYGNLAGAISLSAKLGDLKVDSFREADDEFVDNKIALIKEFYNSS